MMVWAGVSAPASALGPTALVGNAPQAEAESLAVDAYVHDPRVAVLPRTGTLVVTLPLLHLPLGDGGFRFHLTGVGGVPGGSWLGPGWGSSLEARLVPTGPDVVLLEPAGETRRFRPGQGGLFADRGLSVLRSTPDGYTVEDAAGHRRFDREGRLRSVTAGGNEVALEGPPDRPAALRTADATLLELTFSEAGRLTEARDGIGRAARLEYDPAGRLIRVVDFTGLASGFGWDDRGRLSRMSWPEGAESVVEYDGEGRVASLRGAGGAVTTFRYGGDGESDSTTLTDPAGRTAGWRFRKDGREVRVTDAQGATTTKTFDPHGRLVRIEDPAGRAVAFAYDSRHRVTARAAPDGTRETFVYAGPGGTLSEVQSPAGRTLLTRDPNGRVTGVQDEGGSLTAYGYDDEGRLTAVRGSDGAAVTLTRDALGRITAATAPDGRRERYTYDALGNPLTAVDALGRLTEYYYDRAGRPRGHRDPDGRTHLVQVSPDGRQLRQVDARGNQTVASLDPRGEPTWVEVNGRRTRYSRDTLGRLTEVTFPDGAWLRYAYDLPGRLREASGLRSGTVRYAYGSTGQLSEVEWAGAARRRFAYDASGHLTRVEEAGQAAATLEYDAVGRLTRLSDGAGRSWTFGWDRAGRLTSRGTPDGRTERLTYDEAGRLIERAGSDGSGERYAWDSAGRLAGLHRPGAGEQSFAYDGFGRLARNTWPGGALSYAYDPAGNLSRVQEQRSGQAVDYTYDADGLALTRTLPGGLHSEYERDREGNLVRARLGEAEVRVEHDPLRRRKRVHYGQTASAEYAYDPEGRVQSLTVRDASGQPLLGVRYGWDTSGRLVSADHDGKRLEYAYDAVGRLAAARLPDGSRREYAYDRGGSLVQAGSTRFEIDPTGRPGRLRDGTAETVLGWDARGRLAESRSGAGAVRFAYAGEDLVRVEPSGRAAVEYRYDGEGNLAERVEGRDSVRYLVDGRSVAAETDGQGRVRSAYLDGDRLDEHLARLQDGQPQYYVTDLDQSVLAVLDGQGRVLNRYLYGPFGEPLEAREETPNSFRFQGRLYDPATRLYHYRARWYAPQLARFLAPDPLPGDAANPASLEPYAFLDNDPVNRVDPLGTQSASTFDEFVRSLPAVRNFVRTSLPPAPVPGVDPLSSAGRDLAQFASKNLAPTGGPTLWQPGAGLDPGQRATYQSLLSKGFPHRAPPGYALPPRVPTGLSESQAAVRRLQEAGLPNQAGFFQQARNALQDVRQGAQLYGKEVSGTLTLVGGFWGALQQPVSFIAALPGGGVIVAGAVAISAGGGYLIGTGLNQIGPVQSFSTALISSLLGYDKAGLDAQQQLGPKTLAGQQRAIAQNLSQFARSGLPFDPPDPSLAQGTVGLDRNPPPEGQLEGRKGRRPGAKGTPGGTGDRQDAGDEQETGSNGEGEQETDGDDEGGRDETEDGPRAPPNAPPMAGGSAFAKLAGKTLSGTLKAESAAPVSTSLTLTVGPGDVVEGSFRFPVFYEEDRSVKGHAEVKVSGSYAPASGSLSLSFVGSSSREQKDVIKVPKATLTKSGLTVTEVKETLVFRWVGKVEGTLSGIATSDSTAQGTLEGTYTHTATSNVEEAPPSEPWVMPLKGNWTVSAP